MATICLSRELLHGLRCKRQARKNSNAMIAFLTAHSDMTVANLSEVRMRELIIGTFGLLKAEKIGLGFFQKFLNES
jgi:hypothetical protein